MKLDVQFLPIDKVLPNEWNPNKQTERQFEAEVESILANGFLAPILVRPTKTGYEIVDGEHRSKALATIIKNGQQGVKNVPELVANKTIPAIVIEVNDAEAKKLTVIMNETRGRADMGELAILLDSIKQEVGDDLITGLPYSERQLQDLLSLSQFDWDSLNVIETPDVIETDDEEEHSAKIVALLSPQAEILWRDAYISNAAVLPKNDKEAAGKLIEILLLGNK